MRVVVTLCLVVGLLAPGVASAAAPAGSPGVQIPGSSAPGSGAWPYPFTLPPGSQAVVGIAVGAPGPIVVGVSWSGAPLALTLRDPSGRVQKQITGQKPPSVRLDHAAQTPGVWSLTIASAAPPQAAGAASGQRAASATAQGQVAANFPYAAPGRVPATAAPPAARPTGPTAGAAGGTGATPMAAQQSPQQQQVAPGGAPSACLVANNCPPQGSITITVPPTGTTWYAGSYQPIQWTCNGTRSNVVDVSLWQNNALVASVWKGSATGRTAYIVPFAAPPGLYELRATSQGDPRVEARLPLTIAATSVTLAVPPGPLFAGSPYTITWTYTGNMASVKLSVLEASGAVVQEMPNISAGSNGRGSWPWTVAAPPSGRASAQYRFQISGKFRTDMTNPSATAEKVLGASGLFTVAKPSITMNQSIGGTRLQQGAAVPIRWTYAGDFPTVRIKAWPATGGGSALDVTAPAGTNGQGSYDGWKLPASSMTQQYLVKIESAQNPQISSQLNTPVIAVAGGAPTYDMEVIGMDPSPMRVVYDKYAVWSVKLRNNGNVDVVQASVQCSVGGLTLLSLSGGPTYTPGKEDTFLVQADTYKVTSTLQPGTYTGSCTVGITQPGGVTDANPGNNTKGGLTFIVTGPPPPTPASAATPANLYITELALRDCASRGAPTNKAPVCAEITGGNGGPGAITKPWITQCTLGSYAGSFTDSFPYPANRTLLNKVQLGPVAAGNYQLSCTQDTTNQITESNKNDNTRSVAVSVMAGPPMYDMQVLGMDPSPMRVIYDQYAVWSVRLRNNGNADVVQAGVQCSVGGLTLLSLSGGPTFTPGKEDTFLVQADAYKVKSTLQPGSHTGSCTVGIVQPHGASDRNPYNDTKGGLAFIVPAPAPPPSGPANLVISDLALRDCATRGAATARAPVCAEITGGNGGPGTVTKPWVSQCTMGGYSASYTDSFQYPPNRTLLNKVQFTNVTAGDYSLTCTLDTTSQVEETSKSDNTRTVPAKVWP